METSEENAVYHLRLFCMLGCNKELDNGFRMMVQQNVTARLQEMPLPLLERLALSEEDENLKRAAGLIYAWRVAGDQNMHRNEKAERLNALISWKGISQDVAGYVRASLSGYLGWPLEKWRILADGSRPEGERVSASQDVILYCRENGYSAALHRIASDEGMPVGTREMAMCALLEARAGGVELPDDSRKMDLLMIARHFLDEGCASAPLGLGEARRDFILRSRIKQKVEASWERAKLPHALSVGRKKL